MLIGGVAIIYSLTGVTHFETIQLTQNSSLGVVLVMIALVLKLGAAPFHSWAPDLYSRLSFSYTSFFTLLPKLTVLGFLISLLQAFDHSMFALVALLSLIVGAIGIVRS